MASVSSSFHCLSSSRSISSTGSSSPASRVRFQKIRPVSAVCTTSPGAASTFYDVLGIQTGASCQEIKAAYRRLARVLHPDVVAANNGENDDVSADDFIRVHEAYATLSDPSKRADYDRALFIRRRLESPQSASRFTRRSWETDQCW